MHRHILGPTCGLNDISTALYPALSLGRMQTRMRPNELCKLKQWSMPAVRLSKLECKQLKRLILPKTWDYMGLRSALQDLLETKVNRN